MSDYSVTTYTGPPVRCAECDRDVKLLGHSVTWPPALISGASRAVTTCDHMCMAYLLERKLEARLDQEGTP